MTTKNQPLKKSLLSTQSWIRIGIMVLMVVLNKFVQWGINLIALLQAAFVLFKGEKNPQATKIGQQLAQYSFDIMQFLTYNSEERPFPFGGKSPIGQIKPPGSS